MRYDGWMSRSGCYYYPYYYYCSWFFCMAWHGMARGILQAYFAKAVLYPMVVRGMDWLGLACFELTYFP